MTDIEVPPAIRFPGSIRPGGALPRAPSAGDHDTRLRDLPMNQRPDHTDHSDHSDHSDHDSALTMSGLGNLLTRRRLLALAGGAALLSACGSDAKKATTT